MKRNEYLLTYNKKKDKELESLDVIKDKLKNYKYFGIKHDKDSNTHYHIYIYSNNGIRFETLQNKFEGVHIDTPKGTREEIYNYLLHINTNKEKYNENDIFTNIDNIKEFIEYNTNSEDKSIVDMVFNGASVKQILTKYPHIWRSIDKIIKLVDLVNLESENMKKN